DMNSVVNTGFIDCLFHRKSDAPINSSEVYYVLNQFDPSLPLHLDVREVLRERLGDRLLPFVLRRTPAISEALAEGMTVVDYAPASFAAEDFNSLAAWVKARSAPAGAAARGKRWSEK
ncbi:MAG: cellulose synthase operon protein YhjQ/BcsQ, partial [Terracidiphilus sp.]